MSSSDTEPVEVVHLEAIHFELLPPSLPPPRTIQWKSYSTSSPDEIPARVANATVIITNVAKIPASILDVSVTPKLRLVSVVAAGADCVDFEAARKRGVYVCNVPGASTVSVSEHAVGLYFAVRRRIVDLNNVTRGGDGKNWMRAMTLMATFGGKFPRTAGREVVGIVGYGALGKRIERLVRGLGMSALIADRKSNIGGTPPPGRVSFPEVMAKSSVIMICCPLSAETYNLVDEPEFRTMLPDAIIINVGRGGIVNEPALAKALKEGRIAGAATDVFAKEPSDRETSPLLEEGVPNLVVTPHLAWYAESTVDYMVNMTKQNVENFLLGEPQNVLVGPPLGDSERTS